MNPDYWLRQTHDKPLFPELEWSKPENRLHAGKLLVVGGNAHGFAAPAEAYAESTKAGVGTARVLLPDATKKMVGPVAEYIEYAPSTPSGSFSSKHSANYVNSLSGLTAFWWQEIWGVILETAIWLESFLTRGEALTTLTKDAVDYVASSPRMALERPNTTLVLSLSQLQRLAVAAKLPQSVRFNMDLLQLVDWLHDFTATYASNIVVKHLENIFVAVDGQVSTTKLANELPVWRVKAAAHVAVWWLQNATRPFEALTAAIHSYAA